ncbi:hypothetical protein BN136_3888 [Cronobacter universalis NCTC 9529]|nr:hypothetical protein BN136_3888 [Cronobacter universalis NCTC 9529]
MRQLFDIQTARGDISRHQYANAAGFEIRQRAGTGALALVAVDSRGGNAVFIQLLRQMVGAVFGTGKHQHLLPVAVANQIRKQFPLAFFIHEMHMLRDLLGGRVAARHFHFFRVAQQFFRQRFNVVGERRGEQQVLTLRRQLRQHAADVVNKAHVQHTVGFIKHQHFHLVELHGVLVFEIEQTARRCDQHIHAAAQFHHLRVDAHAAEDHQRADIEIFAVFAHVLAHLGCQFARRGQDQRAHRAATVRVRLVRRQALQQRQRKACGFAGAGLGAGHQIFA